MKIDSKLHNQCVINCLCLIITNYNVLFLFSYENRLWHTGDSTGNLIFAHLPKISKSVFYIFHSRRYLIPRFTSFTVEVFQVGFSHLPTAEVIQFGVSHLPLLKISKSAFHIFRCRTKPSRRFTSSAIERIQVGVSHLPLSNASKSAFDSFRCRIYPSQRFTSSTDEGI